MSYQQIRRDQLRTLGSSAATRVRDRLCGSGDGPNTGDTPNLKASNKSTWLPFFNSSKFYGRAEIWVLSCDVGSGNIPQLSADQSGSLVYSYTRTAYGDEKKPWASERGREVMQATAAILSEFRGDGWHSRLLSGPALQQVGGNQPPRPQLRRTALY